MRVTGRPRCRVAPTRGGNVRRTKGARTNQTPTPPPTNPSQRHPCCFHHHTLRYPTIQEPRHDPLISQHTKELAELCRRHHVKRLEIFGSAAVGDFNSEKSDIDFLVDYHPFPGPGKAHAYFGLLEDLQQLFNRQIDLVVDRAIENPYFRDDVHQTREPIYGCNDLRPFRNAKGTRASEATLAGDARKPLSRTSNKQHSASPKPRPVSHIKTATPNG